MSGSAIDVTLIPSTRRQLGDEGLIILWRDGPDPRRREGMACTLSVCPHPDCAGQVVHVDCVVIEPLATTVRWNEEGVHMGLPPGSEPDRAPADPKLVATVDPGSGETTAHPDLPDAHDPALLSWLASEMDGELLDVLHRFLRRAKGYPHEGPRAEIDLAELQSGHLAPFDDLFEGVRHDEYFLADRRYWSCLFLCPYPDCDCHQVRVAFFDDEVETGDTVGSVLLDLGAATGCRIEEMSAECGAPGHLIKDLWALFERRFDVEQLLRRREAQSKAVGETLWPPAAKPMRVGQKPGRNDPCPCGSGRKFKKCCLPGASTPTGN